jgi:hypothetical protein
MRVLAILRAQKILNSKLKIAHSPIIGIICTKILSQNDTGFDYLAC